MNVTLRPYQQKGLDELRAAFKKHRAAIYCLPCGGGKGTCISVMVHGSVARGKRVIFAVHGRALVSDMSRRVSQLGIPHGVLMGGNKREHYHTVQVASIDTLHRMKHRPKADIIIIDEARTFLSATGRMVLDDYPNAIIAGFDATPARMDGKGLGAHAGGIFDTMVMGPSEQELIDEGFLVPCIPIGINEPIDLSKVKKSGGDFNQKELATACDKVKLVGDIVTHWKREASDRKTVAFAVDQNHAKHITEQFLTAGIEWAYVDASTPNEEREKIWDGLANGSLMGVSNCGVCLVGWDLPRISCLISARPTASLPLWRQMLGRGSRIYPGKKDFICLDHAGNFLRHYPVGFFETPPEWTLDGGVTKPKSDEPAPPPVATCKIPVKVPDTGVPSTFKGPLSPDGKWMLGSYHTFAAGPDKCPYCGLPLKFGGRDVEIEDGKLENMAALLASAKAEVKKIKSPKQLALERRQKARYAQLLREVASKKKKDGTPWSLKAAKVRFADEFHFFPPDRWIAECQEMAIE